MEVKQREREREREEELCKNWQMRTNKTSTTSVDASNILKAITTAITIDSNNTNLHAI